MAKQHKPQQNHLLAALPAEVQGRLFPNLELIDIPYGNILYESGDTMRYVYFPVDAIVSLLYVMENGAAAEVSVVGSEDFHTPATGDVVGLSRAGWRGQVMQPRVGAAISRVSAGPGYQAELEIDTRTCPLRIAGIIKKPLIKSVRDLSEDAN